MKRRELFKGGHSSNTWSVMQIQASAIVFFVHRMNSKLEKIFSFGLVFSGIYPFNFEKAEHNTGLDVWCFPVLFCP